ncbi:hypothetical protein V5799_029988 [Amblyomma americanum]|uniref:Peptidase M13 N-terminal domain-containing protein n=1 Tax=Amblyomma americanum TaxID=6943 RepID=A0AAQ4EPG2_AMBAM
MASEQKDAAGSGGRVSKVEGDMSKQSSRKRRGPSAPVTVDPKEVCQPSQSAEEGVRTASSLRRPPSLSMGSADNLLRRSLAGSSSSRLKGETIKPQKTQPSSDGPASIAEKSGNAWGSKEPSPGCVEENVPSQQARERGSALKKSRHKAVVVASSVAGAPSDEVAKQDDVNATAASTAQPPGAAAKPSTKGGAAEASATHHKGGAVSSRDQKAAGSDTNIAPAEQPASSTRGSMDKPGKIITLSPTIRGLKNFDLTDMVRSPRETLGSGAALLLKNEVVIILLLIVTMTFALLALFFLLRVTPSKARDNWCVSDDCLSHAGLLEKTRSTKFDPCSDFSKHVCFNWSPAKEREEIRDFDLSAMLDMVFSWLQRMSTTLQEGSAVFPVAKKALAMLESCMSDSSTYGSNLKNFRQFLDNRSLLWPKAPKRDVDALHVLVNLAYHWEAAFWFEIRVFFVGIGAFGGRWRITLRPAPLLPHYLRQHRAVIKNGPEAYFKYWMDFYTALFGDTTIASKEHALRIGYMEADILETLNKALEASKKDSSVFPIGELEVFTTGINSSRWLHQLQNVTALKPELTGQDAVVTTNLHFLQAVGNLFAKYTNDHILHFLGWQFAQQYAPVSDSGLLVARYGDPRTARGFRPAFCGLHIEVPYRVLLLALRFASRITQRDKNLVDTGFDHLVSAAVRLVNDSTWLDTESKAVVAEKLRSASLRLWPPAKFLNETNLEELFRAFPEKEESFGAYFISSRESARKISRTPEYEAVLEIPENYELPYFEYDYVYNAVGVAIAGVDRPLFYSEGTLGMFYGGFGFSLALELVKALDRQGLQWHPSGYVVSSILSSRSQAVFNAKNVCFNRSEFGAGESVFPEIPALQIAYAAFLDAASEAENTTQISAELTEEKHSKLAALAKSYGGNNLAGAAFPANLFYGPQIYGGAQQGQKEGLLLGGLAQEPAIGLLPRPV